MIIKEDSVPKSQSRKESRLGGKTLFNQAVLKRMKLRKEASKKSSGRVCVTGGNGYIGSWLVRELLKKGYAVNSTLRNIGDESKTAVLKSFHGADERLRLFEADIYDAEKFEPAIEGCECVFLVATPFQHRAGNSQFKNTTEACVSAVRIIMGACERSSSVKRVIYTGSVLSASPWMEDGSGLKKAMDETCWTPLDLPYPYMDEFERDYMTSKTTTEKELLLYNSKEKGVNDIQVVSLVCGLVGGDTVLPFVPGSMAVILSPLLNENIGYKQLKLLQIVLGSISLVHIDDICQAHIFCMERASVSGRFLCANTYMALHEMVTHYIREYPSVTVVNEDVGEKSDVHYNYTRLLDIGFKYKYGKEQILDGSVASAISLGALKGFGEN